MWLKEKLRDYFARRYQVPRMDFALERLRKIGFEPQLIFDVGAYQGDFAKMALHNWPRAQIGSFDVQRDALARLRSELGNKVRVFEYLLGAEENKAITLNLSETASSVLEEQSVPQQKSDVFPMTTIDRIIASEFAGKAPELLKIDTQGYELEILRGAGNNLGRIQVIIAELNLLDLHRDVPLLHDVTQWLSAREWVAYDICGLTRRPLDQALWQADFVFVQESSPLRMDKRWT
jgi:FkbM family methyltransferase